MRTMRTMCGAVPPVRRAWCQLVRLCAFHRSILDTDTFFCKTLKEVGI